MVEPPARILTGGHPKFYEYTDEEKVVHSAKNHDYAKGGQPLGNFTRVGKILELYPYLSPADPKVVALVYALKQLDAVLWGLSQKIEHQVEGLHPRLQDISIYMKLVRCMLHDEATRVDPEAYLENLLRAKAAQRLGALDESHTTQANQ